MKAQAIVMATQVIASSNIAVSKAETMCNVASVAICHGIHQRE